MDQHLIFAIKEEILRNILKSHKRILIIGQSGTGKTVTALKAAKDLGDVYYYNESDLDTKSGINQYKDTAVLLHNIHGYKNILSEQPLLIVDDLDKTSITTIHTITDIISENPEMGKVIVIAQVLMDAQFFLSKMDAVVRFKKDTAEILFTNLYDFYNE